MEKNINIKVGSKVIRADGLAGKITAVFDRTGDDKPLAQASYENDETEGIWKADEDRGFHRFYLLGGVVLGNKFTPPTLSKRIAANANELEKARMQLAEMEQTYGDLKARVERLEAKDKTLRKQRWRLETQMNGDYKEQNPNKDKNVDEESTEQFTEDNLPEGHGYGTKL